MKKNIFLFLTILLVSTCNISEKANCKTVGHQISIRTTIETFFYSSQNVSNGFFANLFDNNIVTYWESETQLPIGEGFEINFPEKTFISKLNFSFENNQILNENIEVQIFTDGKKTSSGKLSDNFPINNSISTLYITFFHPEGFQKFSINENMNAFDTIAFAKKVPNIKLNEINIFYSEKRKYNLRFFQNKFFNSTENDFSLFHLIDNKVYCNSFFENEKNIVKTLIIRSNGTISFHTAISEKNSVTTAENKNFKYEIEENNRQYIKLNLMELKNKKQELEEISVETIKLNINKIENNGFIGNFNLQLPPTALIDIEQLDSTFVLDIRYATNNNFTKIRLYECPKCFLRYEAAKALISANEDFKAVGFQIILYDCYRPFSVQQQMWEIYPNRNFLANPNERASIHNRAGAVDLGLIDSTGKVVDMGTDFDFFGRESYFHSPLVSDTVHNNRLLMREILEKNGFRGIDNEWWHYSFYKAYSYPVLDEKFNCQ